MFHIFFNVMLIGHLGQWLIDHFRKFLTPLLWEIEKDIKILIVIFLFP